MSVSTWTEEELNKAARLFESGMTWAQVGAVFGRSRSGTQAAVRRYQGLKHDRRIWANHGDPIGLETPEIVGRKHAKQASASLRRAINALIAKMPANVAAMALGSLPAREPGTERFYRGQAAERLAA